jgi:hypothetical protein
MEKMNLKIDDQSEMPMEFARELAISQGEAVFLISGPIPMEIGYPQEEHKDCLSLVTFMSHGTGKRKIGLYRITADRKISAVMDDLENHGGYRTSLYLPDGNISAGYSI